MSCDVNEIFFCKETTTRNILKLMKVICEWPWRARTTTMMTTWTTSVENSVPFPLTLSLLSCCGWRKSSKGGIAVIKQQGENQQQQLQKSKQSQRHRKVFVMWCGAAANKSLCNSVHHYESPCTARFYIFFVFFLGNLCLKKLLVRGMHEQSTKKMCKQQNTKQSEREKRMM